MAHVTLMDICDGIAATFDGLMVTLNAGAPAVPLIAQSYDELTEGLHDTPTVHVYPMTGSTDYTSDVDRYTFGGTRKATEYEFRLMAFARPRSHIGEDMEAIVRLWDAIETVLENIECDYFGIADLRNIAWSIGPPVDIPYGGADYVGFETRVIVRFF